MPHLYRLLRKMGFSVTSAVGLTCFAMVTGSTAEARYAAIEFLMNGPNEILEAEWPQP